MKSRVFSWGRADLGALLHDHQQRPVSASALCDAFADVPALVSISSSTYNTCCITASCQLYSCGSNEEGQTQPQQDDQPPASLQPRPCIVEAPRFEFSTMKNALRAPIARMESVTKTYMLRVDSTAP